MVHSSSQVQRGFNLMSQWWRELSSFCCTTFKWLSCLSGFSSSMSSPKHNKRSKTGFIRLHAHTHTPVCTTCLYMCAYVHTWHICLLIVSLFVSRDLINPSLCSEFYFHLLWRKKSAEIVIIIVWLRLVSLFHCVSSFAYVQCWRV